MSRIINLKLHARRHRILKSMRPQELIQSKNEVMELLADDPDNDELQVSYG